MDLKLIFLPILAIIGIAIASYLIYSREKTHGVKVCPTGGGCNAVLNSKYSKTLGMRNDYLGILYYLIIITEYFLIMNLMTNFTIYFKAISSFALLFSIYLFYIQARVIKQYCFYCILTAIVNFFIFLIIIRL